MLKIIVKTLAIAAGLLLSGAVYAVGMGNINVTSALGEPLKAEIELVSVSKADRGNLSARLAVPEVFKGAGMDYPSGLPKLKFQIETRANGSYYIKLSTAQAVNDPFVNILVELSWSSGRLLREYTFLLDPPGFKAEEIKMPEVQPVLSGIEEPAVAPAEPAHEEMVQEEMMQEGAMDDSSMPPSHEAESVAPKDSVMQRSVANEEASAEIKVKRGDTLSQIASENKSADISLERMLVALYRANSDAFDGQNMNRLRTGKILRLPQASELEDVGHAEAVKEVRAQAMDWNAYRQKLAAVSTPVPEQAAKQEVSGKISTSVADKTPPAKEDAKDVVKLSKGEAPGDKAAAKSAQAKKQAQEEDAIAKAKALKESHERIALLEKTNKDMQHLLELKKQAAAAPAKPAAQPPKAEAPKTEAKTTAVPIEPVVASGVTPEPAAQYAKPQPAKPQAEPLVVPPPPSMLDEIMGEPLYLAGGAAVLLGLGTFGYMRSRRSRGDQPAQATGQEAAAAAEADVGDTESHISTPHASSPDTGDFTMGSATAAVAAVAEPDVDPISEADLFLNFGRDAQAEEILLDALKKNPVNQQVKLKLLSIYADRKDAKSFSGIARQVQESGDAAAWVQAASLGSKLEPNNPMYGGAGESVAAVVAEEGAPVEQPKAEESAGLDFDLGYTAAESATAEANVLDVTQNLETSSDSSMLDFDLGESEPATPVDTANTITMTPMTEVAVADMDTMDFDITGDLPAADTAAVDIPVERSLDTQSLDELVPDITPVADSAADNKLEADDGLAFTLDIPETPAEVPVPAKVADVPDLSEIKLDLELPAAAAAAPAADDVKDTRWHDVATKLDLARAYQEMGDAAGAREILEEVLRDGDERQCAAAEAMMQQMSV